MLKFEQYHKQILGETKTEDTLKSHLSHLEDLAIEEGKNGFIKFVEQVENFTNYLEGLKSKTAVNLKIDGSPAIFFGIDPRPEFKEKFFIATKTVFSADPKLIHSIQDVEQYYGDSDPQLKNILKTIFPHLEAGYDGSGKLYQSDLLFSPARPPSQQTIEGKEYLVFKPQLIAYAIPVDNESRLYRLASKAQVGLVIHKGFNAVAQGNRILTTPAGRDTTSIVLSLRKVGVFAESSNYNTLDIHLDPAIKSSIHTYLNKAKTQISYISDEFNAQYVSDTGLVGYLKQYLNEMVRTSGGIFKAAKVGEPFDINKFYEGFISFVNAKIDKAASTKGPRAKANAENKKTAIDAFLRQNNKQFAGLINATYIMISIKNIFLKLLSNVKHELGDMKAFIPAGDKFIVAPGEGHVLYIGDTPNQVKIVDRLDFSANNFKYGGEHARSIPQPKVQIDEEEKDKPVEEEGYSIGFFGGGFNPPHKGHFEAALIAAKENNDVYIIISPATITKERGDTGISTAMKVNIWAQYVPLLEQYKAKIHVVVADVSPVATIYEYVNTLNESPEASEIKVNLYTDIDHTVRYKTIDKYANNLKKVEIKPTPRLASGTEFRAYLAAGNKNGAFELMPRGVDKEAVWRILVTS